MRPRVEVCLVSYDSGEDILKAIASVAEHLPTALIAIQENSHSTRTLDRITEHAEHSSQPIRTLHDASNPGFGAACNVLAETSTAEWLLFLNPDATIIAWPFDDRPPPQRQISGPGRIEATRPESHRGVTYSVLDEVRRSWFRHSGPAPSTTGFVSGAALLVNRDDFLSLDGFDEGFFLFYEDIDFCLRANAAGISTESVDGFAVTHEGAHATSAHFDHSLIWSYESACRFHRLHGHSLVGYRWYVTADSLARWALQALYRNGTRRRAYGGLLRRVLTDLTRRNPA